MLSVPPGLQQIQITLIQIKILISHNTININWIAVTIISYFRTQHATETTKFKTQIDIAENEIVRLEFVLQKEQEARKHAEESSAINNGGNYTVGGTGGNQAGMGRLDISQIEREAAEGQEVDQSLLASSLASPLLMPLDQLLAQPGNSGKFFLTRQCKQK